MKALERPFRQTTLEVRKQKAVKMLHGESFHFVFDNILTHPFFVASALVLRSLCEYPEERGAGHPTPIRAKPASPERESASACARHGGRRLAAKARSEGG
jgi:hypothetical protein